MASHGGFWSFIRKHHVLPPCLIIVYFSVYLCMYLYIHQSCKHSGVSNIVQTHILLLSRDSASFSPSVSKSCRLYSQITRRHNFHCHPDVRLLLSLVRLVVCWDCHVTSFAPRLQPSVQFTLYSTETSSITNEYCCLTSTEASRPIRDGHKLNYAVKIE